MGCHGLPNDLGRRAGTSRRQRSCPRCAMPGVADERHLVFECPAMQPVRDQFAHLFGDDSMTMHKNQKIKDNQGCVSARKRKGCLNTNKTIREVTNPTGPGA